MENNYYVYAWYKIDNLEIFYIGKGLGKRRFSMSKRNEPFLRTVNTYPCAVRILEMGLSESVASHLEKKLISYYKRMGQAKANIRISGSGGDTYNRRTKEEMKITRKKLSDSLKGKTLSEQHVKNMRRALRQKYESDERKEVEQIKEKIEVLPKLQKEELERIKLALPKKNIRTKSEENNNIGFTGKKHTNETKRKMSERSKEFLKGNTNNAKKCLVLDNDKNIILSVSAKYQVGIWLHTEKGYGSSSRSAQRIADKYFKTNELFDGKYYFVQ
ncbi:NUMOD3 domain-containing DNA-binding protein [Gottfriedia sp. NPDC057948]|uniref:NUMOD3 domain-containing DNA-binding protein n=1 Tax=Gottfriedia sp. NPDC057948 TaxID=3346287 RepID=UPI0036D78B0C